MLKSNYNPHNKSLDNSFTPPRKVGGSVSIWMSETLKARIQRIVSENRMSSFSWAVSEAAYQWAENMESLQGIARRDKQELAEVPEVTE